MRRRTVAPGRHRSRHGPATARIRPGPDEDPSRTRRGPVEAPSGIRPGPGRDYAGRP
ncbi:hypothetical protein KPATCC21470_5280 [Kitasatospora purpeofusca]